MHTFKDTAGRTWNIALNIGAVKRVRALCGQDVDLMRPELGQPALIERLGLEIELVLDVIWALVHPQAQSLSVELEGWLEAMGGQAAKEAVEAFRAEYADFFRQLGRSDLAVASDKASEVVNLMVKANLMKAQGIDPQKIADKISSMTPEELKALITGPSSTESPDSAA